MVKKMPKNPPIEPVEVQGRSSLSLERQLLEKLYRCRIVDTPYVKDEASYWVFFAPIRVGWFISGDPAADRQKLQEIWKRQVKDDPEVRRGEKCWVPVEK